MAADSRNTGENQIILSIPGPKFADFITGWLGKPQVINRVVVGTFVVTRDDLFGIHQLLNQRLSDQNEAALVQFQARIRYEDDLTIELSSIEDLAGYAEIKPAITDEISLTWVYLITFRGKVVPERQQIEVLFRRKRERGVYEVMDGEVVVRRGNNSPRVVSNKGSGYSVITISHTLRSWGSDIEGLLYNHVRTLFRDRRSNTAKLINRGSIVIGYCMFLGVASVLVAIGKFILRRITASYEISPLSSNMSTADAIALLNHKLDLLYTFSGGGRGAALTVGIVTYLVIGAVLAILSAIFVKAQADAVPPSHLVFTAQDDIHLQDENAAYQREWQGAAVCFLLSILGSIIANIITVVFW